jgi:hypothetical protein
MEDDSRDDPEDDGSRWLSAILPARNYVLVGDLRLLYLGWLAVQTGDVEDDAFEPPVPAGLQRRSLHSWSSWGSISTSSPRQLPSVPHL